MGTLPEMLTTCASSFALSCGRNASVPRTTPQKLMSISHSKSVRFIAPTKSETVTPALFTTTCAPPSSRSTSLAKSLTSVSLRTSTLRERLRFAPASFSVSFTPASFQSESARNAPRFPASTASARPIPEPAPVMTTTFSLRLFIKRHLSKRGP